MSNLTAFLRPNVAQIENSRFTPSPRFRGEDGKPLEWEIRCIPADEYSRIRSECIRQEPVPGKKGQFTQRMDTGLFQARICAACTVFPDLKDAQLQDSWGCARPEELLGKMLTGGEFDSYFAQVFRMNGFQSEDELADQAKN